MGALEDLAYQVGILSNAASTLGAAADGVGAIDVAHGSASIWGSFGQEAGAMTEPAAGTFVTGFFDVDASAGRVVVEDLMAAIKAYEQQEIEAINAAGGVNR